MAKKNNTKVIVIFAILGIIAYFFFSSNGGGGGGGFGTPKNRIECNVPINNPTFSDDFYIDGTASCTNVGQCGLISSTTFSTVSNTAKVRLKVNNAVKMSQSVVINEIGITEAHLSGCIPEEVNSGLIEIVNSDNSVTDSQSVNF